MSDEKDERKERVLHTRVPPSLDDQLKQRARSLGMSVSTIVRHVLLNTFGLVEDIVTDSTNAALALGGQDPVASLAVTRRRARPGERDAGEDDEVLGWQEAVLNLNAVCSRCNAVLCKGSRAAIGVRGGPAPAPSCVPSVSPIFRRGDDVMELRTVTLHGHTVAYRTAGEGPVVLLVHGMAGNSASWSRVIPTLARRFTVLAPDLFGHGSSSKHPLGEYSVSGHANLLHDLLAALGHERATLVGQSFGGGVVMQLAYQFPDQCERLVLVSSGGLGREVGTLLRMLSLPGAEHVLPLGCSPRLRDAGARIGEWLAGLGLRAGPVVQEIWRGYAGLADRDARVAFFRTLRAVVDAGGQAVSAVDRLYLASSTPLLIVWGSEDALIPVDHAHAAHAAIPGSRLEIFPGVGHFPHVEAPERFLACLEDFIDATAPARLSEHQRRALLQSHARLSA